MNTREKSHSIFWADEGFSTAGMVVALLLTLALIFTCARVYEVNTSSAQVQETADAAALAAENIVAEFYIVATLCDAVVFTLALGAVVFLGISVVCTCIPGAAAAGKTFLEAAHKTKEARDSFYESAQKSLTKLEKALPFLAAAKAEQVLMANNGGAAGSQYVGAAILVPWQAEEGEALSFGESDEAFNEAESVKGELEKAAAEAEEAAKKANEWKEKAYKADCGSREEYCMFERAAKLAGMQGQDNPFFSSVETWNFGVALDRAKVYYAKRAQTEAPEGSSVDDRANSALRKRFYEFAYKEVSRGFVNETDSSFSAEFPLLPKNTSEMKGTVLYSEAIYPITAGEQGLMTMHAWAGCPGAQGKDTVGVGSLSQLDGSSSFVSCSSCKLAPSSMGKVAAASSTVENGFEYHYRIVAEAAEGYEKERAALGPAQEKVKGLAEGVFDKIKEALGDICGNRIEVFPPGRYGVVALVADISSPSSNFPSSFVEGSALGTRAAVSAATLVKEESDEGKTVITSFFDGFSEDEGSSVGPMRFVMGLWSGLLSVYAQGQEAITEAIRGAVDSLPLASESGLGNWAGERFEELLEGVGFEAPDLRARKPVLVNSGHVLAADSSGFSARLLSVKERATNLTSTESNPFGSALSEVEAHAQDALSGITGEFEIATVVLFDGAVEIPITVSLPAGIQEGLSSALSDGMAWLRGVVASWTGVRQWE